MPTYPEQELVIFVATDDEDEFYFYRQAFAEVCPLAILYFFTRKAELLNALKGKVYPKPVLILMDWNMASRKGYVALAWLAQSPVWQTVPVVIMTDELRSIDEAKCARLGYELVLPREKTYAKQLRQLRGLVQAFV